MSSAEFSMWIKLLEDDPWDEHVDLAAGQICANIANYAGMTRSKDAPPAHPSDFMPLPRPAAVIEEPDPLQFFGMLK